MLAATCKSFPTTDEKTVYTCNSKVSLLAARRISSIVSKGLQVDVSSKVATRPELKVLIDDDRSWIKIE